MDKTAVALAAIALTAAAGAGYYFLAPPSAEDVGQEMGDRYLEVEDYEGMMEVNAVMTAQEREPPSEEEMQRQAEIAAEEGPLTYEEALENIREQAPEGGEEEAFNRTTVAEVRYLAPDRYRYDYLEGDVDAAAVTVDGEELYFHREGSEPEARDPAVVGFSTLGIPLSDWLPTFTDDYHVEFNESLTDEDRYVLDVEVRDDADVELDLDRVHVDRDDLVPTKVYRRSEQRDSFGAPTGDVLEQRVWYDFDYDVDVSGEAFDVDVVVVEAPEPVRGDEAEEEDAASDTEGEEDVDRGFSIVDDYEAAEEIAGFEVSPPEYLPDDYELVQVMVRTENGVSSIDPTYSTGEEDSAQRFAMRFTVEFERFADDVPDDAPMVSVEEVEVGDRTAELRRTDGMPVLVMSMDCGELSVEVSSANIDEEEMKSVLASVDC